MNLLSDALAWLIDPANWTGPSGIPTRAGQHLAITALTILLAGLIAWPAGVLIGHSRRGSGIIGALTGAARAIPTLGLLTLFGLALGIGLEAPLLALIVLAIPSLLAGAYAGIQAIDPAIAAAARAIGMSPAQVILTVEIPLALPVIIGGLRSATLQVVATATLAAYIADIGLGRYLFTGLKSRDYSEMLGGALAVVVLTLILDVALAGCQRLATRRIIDPAPRARLSTTRTTGKNRNHPCPTAPSPVASSSRD
ncbi:ABC transporter permease [Propionibacterium australiense]|uniref:Binding-protein-dependent transport system inner membrane component n=1 Tax=Propionibacterium australiense TaxID=119981 RepID=A0A383S354_9ACTN|nr:ABC transporter permease subunit [Propionibacterium australiense]RLP11723.1 ABC transporter permease subunit [Propionibacterium australiense]SYZ32468.1 Binding-protein-dependent transport system inner membrane component [Propionibacterium australiense]VEH90151.1 Putative osmoprotectant uptake system permease protein yehY [Propionibacterium australiense]